MRIACPKCSAEYEVPDSLLAAGPRLLRCARCSHQFQAAAPGSEAEPAPPPPAAAAQPEPAPPSPLPGETPPPDPPTPEPTPPAESVPPAEPARAPLPPMRERGRLPPLEPPVRNRPLEPAPRTGAALTMAWLISFAVLGAAGWATYRYHAEIVEAWPPAARLYQALGLR